MEPKTYFITEKAGRYVAGRKLAKGQKTIVLTEPEARYELDLGTISERDPKAAAAPQAAEEVAAPPARKSAKG